jgi:hypothetical protein
VTWSIDDVKGVFLTFPEPLGFGSSRSDRDPTLLFLLHPVHSGCAIVYFTDLVTNAGVVKDALGSRRFARVDVSSDTDVSGEFKISCHGFTPMEFMVKGL